MPELAAPLSEVKVTFLAEGDESRSSGAKFVVDGSFLTSSNPTTASWLQGVTALQLIDEGKSVRMNHKKLLEGVLVEGGSKVVIKIADSQEDIEHEWNTFRDVVHKHRLPGFAQYMGFFRCNDALPRVLESGMGNKGLCDGSGDSMQVLVMEHVDNPSMKRFDWTTVDERTAQSCIMQVICTSLEAFLVCKFVHGDMHLDNILLEVTDEADVGKYLRYERAGMGIVAGGLRTKMMDLEFSKAGSTIAKFFQDILNLFNKAVGDLMWCFDISPLQTCYRQTRAWIDADEQDPRVVLALADGLAELRRCAFAAKEPPERYGGRPSRRAPRLHKRRGVW